MGNTYRTLRDLDADDSDGKIVAIRLMLNSPANEGKIILVVEGPDDIEVYGRMFDPNLVEVYADGACNKHTIVLSTLNPFYKKRLAAIKDADFDILNGKVPVYDNLFITDKHDLEGMILCEGIPQSVIDMYPNRCSGFGIDDIYSDLRTISYLRWMNDVYYLGFDFNSQSWSYHYSKPYDINIVKYLSCLLGESHNDKTFSKDDLDRFIAEKGPQDLTMLVRGHDLMQCLYIRAKDKDNSNFEKKKFFRSIRDSYSLERFAKTQLYSSLYSYMNPKH